MSVQIDDNLTIEEIADAVQNAFGMIAKEFTPDNESWGKYEEVSDRVVASNGDWLAERVGIININHNFVKIDFRVTLKWFSLHRDKMLIWIELLVNGENQLGDDEGIFAEATYELWDEWSGDGHIVGFNCPPIPLNPYKKQQQLMVN